MTMPVSSPAATVTLPSRKDRKTVGVVIRRGPREAPDVEEALRVALGQTLAAGRVVVALVEAGVWAAAPALEVGGPGREIEKHLDMLLELGQELVVEAEALRARGIPGVREGVTTLARTELLSRLGEADIILNL
jgi:sulfur relay (sulfurtransferase) DsrF/TusC family protein